MKKLKEWARGRYTSALQGVVARANKLRDWVRDRFYMSVLRTIAERFGAGLGTAAVVGMLVDPTRNGWAVVALGIAGGLFYFAARKPKGEKQ